MHSCVEKEVQYFQRIMQQYRSLLALDFILLWREHTKVNIEATSTY